jgi:hypothetical protein
MSSEVDNFWKAARLGIQLLHRGTPWRHARYRVMESAKALPKIGTSDLWPINSALTHASETVATILEVAMSLFYVGREHDARLCLSSLKTNNRLRLRV